MRSAFLGRTMLMAGLMWTTCGTAAAAGDESLARTKRKVGVALFQDDDYSGALKAFEASYVLEPRTSVLFNIAMCQKALLLYVESIETFEKYRAQAGKDIKPERKAEIEEQIRELTSLLTKLEVSDAPDGAGVYVDGTKKATCPLDEPISLNPGSHVIEVKRDGFEPFRKEVKADKGWEIVISANLKSLGGPPADRGAEPSAPSEAGTVEKSDPAFREPGFQPDEAKRLTLTGPAIAGLSIIGLGVVSGVLGGIFTSKHLENRDSAQDERSGYKAGMIAGWVGAGVCLSGGAALLVLGLKKRESKGDRTAFRPSSDGFALSF
jgi:hypothetical protein